MQELQGNSCWLHFTITAIINKLKSEQVRLMEDYDEKSDYYQKFPERAVHFSR